MINSMELSEIFEKVATSDIETVEIRHRGLSDENANELSRALAINDNLIELNVSSSRISSLGITTVCHGIPRCLKHLFLSYNPITTNSAASALAKVLKTTTLQKLYLNNCQLTNQVLSESLGSLSPSKNDGAASSLEKLKISQNNLSSEEGETRDDCKKIGYYLAFCTALRVLDISSNQFSNLQPLQLYRIESLQELIATDNKMKNDGHALGDVIRYCLNLKVLDISDNKNLTKKFFQEAFVAGGQQLALEVLILSLNSIGDDETVHLATLFLPRAIRLQCLDMARNNIGDRGAQALACYLETASTIHLRTLDLHRNKFSNNGGEALVDSLVRSNFYLTELSIHGNFITNSNLYRQGRFYGKLNKVGHYILQQQHCNNVPIALWPYVLRKMNILLDVRYYFLRRLPEIFLLR